MTPAASAPVRQFVLDHIGEKLATIGVATDGISEQFDLLAEGVVDSFGFLELINLLEQRFEVELDFDGVDADELTVFGPFCSYVERLVEVHSPSAIRSVEGVDGTTARGVKEPESTLRPPTPPVPRHFNPVRRALGHGASGAYSQGVRLRDKAFSLLASGSFASYGSHTVLQLPIRLSGEHRIEIGSDGFIGANSWLQVLEGEGDHVAISIGDGVSIAGLCVLSAARSIRIGRNVSFARNVYIADHSHAYDDPEHPILAQGITAPRSVEIGDGAWLGENVLILPGVRIGSGAVISANSVVNQDIPNHCVAAGSPARVVRHFGVSREGSAT